MSEGGVIETGLQAVGVGGGAGGAIFGLRWLLRWLADRHDRRQAQLDAQHGALDQSWKSYRLTLEAKLAELDARDRQRGKETEALRLAFELVAAELRRDDPNNGALRRAELLLSAAYTVPVDPITPPAFGDLLQQMDEADGRVREGRS